MTDTELDAAAAAVGHDGKLVRENNQGWRQYSKRDAEGHFSSQVRKRIQQEFKVNIFGMAGGDSLYEVVTEHRLRCDAGGGCVRGLGGASVAAAAAPGWTKEVCDVYPDFSIIFAHQPSPISPTLTGCGDRAAPEQ